MRSRKSIMNDLNRVHVQNRNITLENLDELDASLLFALLELMPPHQVYLPKGVEHDVVFDHQVFRISFNHDLLKVLYRPLRVHIVNLIENVSDVIHYQYGGRLEAKGRQMIFIPSVDVFNQYFINFDHPLPRSDRFHELVSMMLNSHPKTAYIYRNGSVYQLGSQVQLHIKVQGAIQIRPSTSQRHPDQMRLEWVAPNELGKGTFGFVSKALTYSLMGERLERAKRQRVTKAINQRVDRVGTLEPPYEFTARVNREYYFAGLFGLKPKPPLFDWLNKTAYLTLREAPGNVLHDWMLVWHKERQNGRLMTPDLAYRVSLACLKALTDLHAKDVIHGDIKSNNIVIHERGDGEVIAQLIDAGAACGLDESVRFIAHKSYACPESSKREGRVCFNSQAADVYAMGIDLAYLWGFEYINDENSEKRYRVMGQPASVADLSDHEKNDIKRWMQSILKVNPSHRYTAKRAADQLAAHYKLRLKERSSEDESSSPQSRQLK